MNKFLTIFAIHAIILGAYAQTETSSKENETTTSSFDQVIEVLAESSIQNPDYGKDISDR